MPTVIGHHDISKGKDHWLASPKREEVFGPLGVTNIRTFVNPENPTQVAVLMDVADLDALMAAMQSEAAAEAMAHDCVVPEIPSDPHRGVDVTAHGDRPGAGDGDGDGDVDSAFGFAASMPGVPRAGPLPELTKADLANQTTENRQRGRPRASGRSRVSLLLAGGGHPAQRALGVGIRP